jgi:hypothetical protein
LAAGKAVAPLAAQGVQQWHPQLMRQWEVTYRRLLSSRQQVCRVVAAVLRSPWLTRAAVRLLALTPALATPMTRYLGTQKVQ